jgi:AcrR family transcriptional regulator
MQPKASDANDGGAAKSGRTEIRNRIMEAMLEVAGEVGYRAVSAQRVIDHYGGNRTQFYRHFIDTTACYQAAYAAESERVGEAILRAGRHGDSWRAGLEAALEELVRYAVERPTLARGVLLEVHAAGGPARSKRKEVFERLSRAIDSARRETMSRHSPPPLTPMFIIQVFEAAMGNALIREAPERFPIAELVNLVALYYDLPSSQG